MEDVTLSVSDFVALCNQTLEYAYPVVKIQGEVTEFRISKNRWLYFKLQDDTSTVAFFGSVYVLQHAIEDGMEVIVLGSPRLHQRYGFSVNVRSIVPVGEGSILRSQALLKAKLQKEGLFDAIRKRPLPQYPLRIGLITSSQAAAYSDYVTQLRQRSWDIEVLLADVQVQGLAAQQQIVRALQHFNEMQQPVDILVITRGGGSAEDLQAFSAEEVVRAIASSRTPTLVGVGHERDTSLADLAADRVATTPTHAAQLSVPDGNELLHRIELQRQSMGREIDRHLSSNREGLHRAMGVVSGVVTRFQKTIQELEGQLQDAQSRVIADAGALLQNNETILKQLDPRRVLRRGYAIVRDANGAVIGLEDRTLSGDSIVIELQMKTIEAEVKNVQKKR